MTSSLRKVVCMFRINFPTKRIFRIFPILRTDGMAQLGTYLWNDPRMFTLHRRRHRAVHSPVVNLYIYNKRLNYPLLFASIYSSWLWPAAAHQLACRRLLYFTADVASLFIYFFAANLRRLSADHHQTLPCVCWWLYFVKWSKFGVSSEKSWQPKNVKILVQFQTTSWLDRGYLQIGTRCRRSEKGIQTAVTPMQACQIWWVLVHKWRKIGL